MRVLLTFTGADTAPQGTVLFSTATEGMQDEVFDYLKTNRLPCLPESSQVRSVQEFAFDHDAPSHLSVLRALPAGKRPGARGG
jgi:hypothetical protein